MFSFDRRTARQHRARQALLTGLALSAPCYALLDIAGTRLFGGFWGVLLALAAVGTPLGAFWWMSETGQRPRQAWRAGAGLALAAIALYAVMFGGRW